MPGSAYAQRVSYGFTISAHLGGCHLARLARPRLPSSSGVRLHRGLPQVRARSGCTTTPAAELSPKPRPSCSAAWVLGDRGLRVCASIGAANKCCSPAIQGCQPLPKRDREIDSSRWRSGSASRLHGHRGQRSVPLLPKLHPHRKRRARCDPTLRWLMSFCCSAR